MAITKEQREEVKEILTGFFAREKIREQLYCSLRADLESEEEDGFVSRFPGLEFIREKVKERQNCKEPIMAVTEKDELDELLESYFAYEAEEREADEAGYRFFMDAPENPEYNITPDCPTMDRIREVWLKQATWNPEEKQHIDSCRHCRVFVPYFQTRLSDRALQS